LGVEETIRKVFDGFNPVCAERYEHQGGYTRNALEFVRNTEFSSLCIETSLGVAQHLHFGTSMPSGGVHPIINIEPMSTFGKSGINADKLD
jgi:hypothetical protein